MLFHSRLSHFLGLLTYLCSAALNITSRKGSWERMVQPSQPPVNCLWTLFIHRCGAGQNFWPFPIPKVNNLCKLCHRAHHVTFWDLSFISSLFFALSPGFAKWNIFFSPIHDSFRSLCLPFLFLSITWGNASSPFHVKNKSKKGKESMFW